MQTLKEKRECELAQAEFRRMKDKVREVQADKGTFMVDGLPSQFHFSLYGEPGCMTVRSMCHNLTGGEHAGRDPGIEINTPDKRFLRYVAVTTGEDFIGWRRLVGNQVEQKLFSTEEISGFLLRWFI